MLYGVTYRMIAGIVGAVAVAAFIALAFHWKTTMTARGQEIARDCIAARSAVDDPKLNCKLIPQAFASLSQTIANVRNAAAQAKIADAANLARVKGEQSQINEDSANAYEARVAAARAAADKLRAQLAAEANSGSRPRQSVPGVPSTASVADKAADDTRLSIGERLVATEQAIQLDELIKWVKKQAGVDVSGKQP